MPELDQYTQSIRQRTQASLLTVGIGCGDISAENLSETSRGTSFQIFDRGELVAEAEIKVPGQHMVVNALLAVAVGKLIGDDWPSIATGLYEAELTGGRLQQSNVNGIEILDDSYNANPDSMSAAIKTLAGLPCEGRRVAALGVMAELGEHAEACHRVLGEEVEAAGIDLLVTVGELPALAAENLQESVESQIFADCESAAVFLKAHLKADDLLLVKGSRSAGMEKVIEGLKN